MFLFGAGFAQAGSSSIDLTGDYEQVFATPSGNILCGGGSLKKADTTLYQNDLYCFVYRNKNTPKRCLKQGVGLDFTLNAAGGAKQHCAGFEFPPENEGREKTRILQYGETVAGKGWSCTGETVGLTCRNAGGHGFTLNSSRYRLF